MQKPPSLRNNNGSLQVRVRIDGRDAFINRLGRWSDPVAVARAHAISAQIWSDYQQGSFDRSLMAYQPLVDGKQVGLLEALRLRETGENTFPAADVRAPRCPGHSMECSLLRVKKSGQNKGKRTPR